MSAATVQDGPGEPGPHTAPPPTPPPTAAAFWAAADGVRARLAAGVRQGAAAELAVLACRLGALPPVMAASRLEFLGRVARAHGLPRPAAPVAPGAPVEACAPQTAPGLSLVTGCHGHTAALVRVLPSWLAQPGLDEIVVVDWGSAVPVALALAAAGLTDPRLLVLRVEGTPRWSPAAAFSLGLRVVGFDTVLKMVPDIRLDPDALSRLRPPGAVGPAAVLRVARADLMAVGGPDPVFEGTDRADAELCARLAAAGRPVLAVDPAGLHRPDAEAEGAGPDPIPAADELARDPAFLTRVDEILAAAMPRRGPWVFSPAFRVLAQDPAASPRVIRVEPAEPMPDPVPEALRTDAHHYAALALLAERFGPAALALDHGRRALLLGSRPWQALSPLDLAIALGPAPRVLGVPGARLVIDLPEGISTETPFDAPAAAALVTLAEHAAVLGLIPVLVGPASALPTPLQRLPVVPQGAEIGALTPVDAGLLSRAAPGDLPAGDLRLVLDAAALRALDMPSATSAPLRKRPLLCVEVRGGLAHRLCALAAAAVLASRSDRDLVVVWDPEPDCDAPLSALFDYSGPVRNHAFAETLRARGALLHTDLPALLRAGADAGADGGAPAVSGDILLRPVPLPDPMAGTLASESRFLQALRPVAEVRAMVASVRHPNALAIHVAGASPPVANGSPAEPPDALAQTHLARIVGRIDALIAEGRGETLFAAPSRPGLCAALSGRYGDRLAFLPAHPYDGSVERVRHDLAEAILLGRATQLIGSRGHAVCALALRLAPEPIEVEWDGTDTR